MANLLPMNLMHETVRDVEINGYKLEKGTTVVAQISTVMYNEEVTRSEMVENTIRKLFRRSLMHTLSSQKDLLTKMGT